MLDLKPSRRVSRVVAEAGGGGGGGPQSLTQPWLRVRPQEVTAQSDDKLPPPPDTTAPTTTSRSSSLDKLLSERS